MLGTVDRPRVANRQVATASARTAAPSRSLAVAIALLWIAVALPTLAPARAAAAPVPMSWAAPLRADDQAPFASTTEVTAVACPSAGLCVAGDRAGDILSSTEPAGGSTAWKVIRDSSRYEGLTAISCPSTGFCVAVGGRSIVSSTDPAGGLGAWSGAVVDEGSGYSSLSAISCPSQTLCVAVDSRGNVLTSSDPTGGASAWQAAAVYQGELRSVSCPSSKLCLAVGRAGEALISTDPSGGASAWGTFEIKESHELNAVSCLSNSLCVMTNNFGDVLTSTNPKGGPQTWDTAHVSNESLIENISCSPKGLCAATTGGEVITSSDPAGGAQAWTATPIEIPSKFGGSLSLAGASCPAANLCVLTDYGSGVVTSTEPTGGEEAWHVTTLEIGSNALSGVSCVSETLCVAVDQAGNVISSSEPLSDSDWSSVHVDGHSLSAISCASAGRCVAVDDAGDVLVSSNPTGGAGAWGIADVDGTNALDGVSCASNNLCVAIDQRGNVLASSEPAAAADAWKVAAVSAQELEGVSCPSETLCVATSRGAVITSTDPTGGASAWHAALVGTWPSISCPSTGLCVSLGHAGYSVLTSTEPTGGESAWSETELTNAGAPSFNGFYQVGCAPGVLCVASTLAGNGSPGNVMVTSDPTGGAAAWNEENVYGLQIEAPNPEFELYSIDLSGISCVPEGMCVVVDTDGKAMIGTSQALPELGRCLKLSGKRTGRYKSAACTKPSTGEDNGRYEWQPWPGLENGFAAKGGVVNLETTSRQSVKCSENTLTGAYTGPRRASASFVFTGCETANNPGVACQSAGAGAGEIRTAALGARLGVIKSGPKPSIGWDLSPASEANLMSFDCGERQITVVGSVISPVSAVDKMSASFALKFKAVRGRQRPEGFEGALQDTLTLLVEGHQEQAGLTVSDSLAGEEPLEIKAIS